MAEDAFILKENHRAEYQRINRAARRDLVRSVFYALLRKDSTQTYPALLREISKRLGVGVGTLSKTASSLDLRAGMQQEIVTIIKMEEVQKMKVRHDGISRDIPFSKMISEIKDFSWLLVTTSHSMAKTNIQMVEYYSNKINNTLNRPGGIDAVTADDAKQIEAWQENLKFYTNNIKEFLKPNQIATLLKMVGIEAAVGTGMEEIDQSAFTMQRLQDVFTTMFGAPPTIGNPDIADEVMAAYKDIMPDIDAKD